MARPTAIPIGNALPANAAVAIGNPAASSRATAHTNPQPGQKDGQDDGPVQGRLRSRLTGLLTRGADSGTRHCSEDDKRRYGGQQRQAPSGAESINSTNGYGCEDPGCTGYGVDAAQPLCR